ncbi:MAG: site-specific integrase [Pseudomonadota bacterium]
MPLELKPPGTRKGNKFYLIRGVHEALGRRLEISTGTRNRALAQRRLIELIERLDREAMYGPQTTFAEAALKYMDDVPNGGRFLVPILEHFGPNTLIAEITPQVIDVAARAIYPNTQPQTRHRQAVTPITAVINHHQRGGPKKQRVDNARVRWLTPEDAEQLIECAQMVDRDAIHSAPGHGCERLVLTLLGTGCRTSELIRLRRSNINPATRQAFIGKTKNGDPRWIPIETTRAYPALMNNCPDTGGMFRTPRGKEYVLRDHGGGQFAGMFNKARDLAGFDAKGEAAVTPHVLRHTWATWYYAATGHNLTWLMEHGGWRKPDMAMRYSKLAPADLAQRIRAHGWSFVNPAYGAEPDTQAAPIRTKLRILK